MIVARTKREARRAVDGWRGTGPVQGRGVELGGRGGVALVPTMGGLHEGHLALIDRARAKAGFVALSIYVNPLQFGPREDFEQYPRPLERDLELAAGRGTDLVFAPSDREMYAAGEPSVQVVAGGLAERLCGAYRPGHFAGVLTVVAKLFHIIDPDLAVFGQKDYQQALLIRRMVADLDIPVTIDVAPTVREPDGLALSSRNRYLSPEDRAAAAALPRGLDAAVELAAAGERSAAALAERVRECLAQEPRMRAQYIELVDPETLAPVERAQPGAVLAAAVFAGETRLIDNRILP